MTPEAKAKADTKRCAIIALDEILEATKIVKELYYDYHNPLKIAYSIFCQQVKQAIIASQGE